MLPPKNKKVIGKHKSIVTDLQKGVAPRNPRRELKHINQIEITPEIVVAGQLDEHSNALLQSLSDVKMASKCITTFGIRVCRLWVRLR